MGVREELRIGRKNGLDEIESDEICEGRLRMEEAEETLKEVVVPTMAVDCLRSKDVCFFHFKLWWVGVFASSLVLGLGRAFLLFL
ncbi:hypothetical protein C1H46_036130 [Malus baccata]|uniref:Transmembrane protein n=1 Tax=Malus baccata TaxID=106549 RepID=A0A540KVR2_MALBA|nr:hypothetical protein C1H46_036130 [Malus baccata]